MLISPHQYTYVKVAASLSNIYKHTEILIFLISRPKSDLSSFKTNLSPALVLEVCVYCNFKNAIITISLFY